MFLKHASALPGCGLFIPSKGLSFISCKMKRVDQPMDCMTPGTEEAQDSGVGFVGELPRASTPDRTKPLLEGTGGFSEW